MALEKFSSQADDQLLLEIKALAKSEGKQLQALISEAFIDLLEKRKQTKPRPHVLDYFQQSLGQYDPLYEKLAQ